MPSVAFQMVPETYRCPGVRGSLGSVPASLQPPGRELAEQPSAQEHGSQRGETTCPKVHSQKADRKCRASN